jgi:non-specific serine/threonine protein kinase
MPGGLPIELTSYVGRRVELAEAAKLLPASAVVTLAGPGGVGKTRLAIRVAEQAAAGFPDGVIFVELAELRDAELLADTVAFALGLQDQSARATVDTIIRRIGTRRMLLVLDNCEHLIVMCAQLVAALVADCPGLVVLATSRQSLGVVGERILPVAPLPVPDPADVPSAASVAGCDAVRLFVDRARAVLPAFAVTDDNCRDLVALCGKLDGLPLAIELAAVRLRSLSLRQIADRLGQRLTLLTSSHEGSPLRQRTLRALIDWSHELCSEAEQQVWARASVFAGSFTLDAADQVCSGAGVDEEKVFDHLDALLDKSVLGREESDGVVRYRMLEVVRQYGQHQLARSGDRDRVMRRHRDWYAGLAARFDAGWLSAEQATWITRLRREHPNLRTALDFCVTVPGESVAGLRIVNAIPDYWGISGMYAEGRIWLERLVAVAPVDVPERVGALITCGRLALMQEDLEVGVARLTEAGELAEDPVETAFVSGMWGLVALFSGEAARGVELLGGALDTFQERGVLRGELILSYLQGLALGLAGEMDRGRSQLAHGIARSAACGETIWRVYALWALALIETVHGDPDAAEAAAHECLRLARPLDLRLAAATATETLAWTAQRKGSHRRAAVLFGAADTIWRGIGVSPHRYVIFGAPRREHLELTRHALGTTDFDRAFAQGGKLTFPAAIAYALDESPTVPAPRVPHLTKRETQIAELVAKGLTNREIATRLNIALRTADTHVENILAKLQITTRTKVATWITTQSP